MDDVTNAGAPAPATTDVTGDTGKDSGQDNNAGANDTASKGTEGDSLITSAQKDNAESTGAPEKYDFSSIIPEGAQVDEKAASEFGNIAKELNLSQEQANKLATYGFGWLKNNMDAVAAARVEEVTGWADDTRKALGGEFDTVVSKAATTVDAIEKVVPGFKKTMDITGAGNRVEVIRAMAHFSQFIQQDNGHGGSANNSSNRFTYDKTDFSKY